MRRIEYQEQEKHWFFSSMDLNHCINRNNEIEHWDGRNNHDDDAKRTNASGGRKRKQSLDNSSHFQRQEKCGQNQKYF